MPSFNNIEVTVIGEVSVDFEVFCSKCGAGLCLKTRTSRRRGMLQITVDPCEKCILDATEEGYREAEKDSQS